jgi:hypothetical protein
MHRTTAPYYRKVVYRHPKRILRDSNLIESFRIPAFPSIILQNKSENGKGRLISGTNAVGTENICKPRAISMQP